MNSFATICKHLNIHSNKKAMSLQNVDTKDFQPKDAKIIRDNVDKSPYELLELGLSQKAYDRLAAGEYKTIEAVQEEPLQPAAVEKATKQHSASENAVIQPSKVESFEEVVKGKPAAATSKNNDLRSVVKIRDKQTGEVISTTQYFAQLAVKTGTHTIV